MSKVGNYIVGASVVAVMAGSALKSDEVKQFFGDESKDKIEYVKEELKEDIKEFAIEAFEMLSENVNKLKKIVNGEESNSDDKEELKSCLKRDSHFAYETIEKLGKAPRIKDLQYQNDTLNVASVMDVYSNAYYEEEKNTITNNIVKGEDKDYNEMLSILAHEAEHMHQHNKVNFMAGMSVEQHYKKHCYKEIGARIAGLLQYRAIYKEAKTSKERQEIVQKGCSGGYDYYFKAIKEGMINPRSNKQEDFDKEMKFIAQETTSNWMTSYAEIYDGDHIRMVKENVDKTNLKPNDENYNKAVSALLTMGGINFFEYLEDIDVLTVNSTVIKADEMIKNGEKPKKVMDFVWKKDAGFSNLLSAENGEFDGFSLEQKYTLAVNKYFASFYKYRCNFDENLGSDEWKKSDFITTLQNVCKKYNIMGETEKLVDRLSEKKSDDKEASNEEYLQKIREIWTFENKVSGNQFCLLDEIGVKEPDFSLYVAKADVFKEKDDSLFLGIIKNVGKDLFETVDDMVAKIMSKSSEDVIKDEPLKEPRYDLLWHEGRSEVYTTSQVIDTRGDYLVKEREEREKMQNVEKKKKNKLNKEVNSKGYYFEKVDAMVIKKMRGGGR